MTRGIGISVAAATRACTPLDRLLRSGILPVEEAQALLSLRASIDLEALKERIERRIMQIYTSADRTSRGPR